MDAEHVPHLQPGSNLCVCGEPATSAVHQSLLARRRIKDLARIEKVCVWCGAPDTHCQCKCNCTEDGRPYCGEPECDVDFCQDCGDEYSEPCKRHAGTQHEPQHTHAPWGFAGEYPAEP